MKKLTAISQNTEQIKAESSLSIALYRAVWASLRHKKGPAEAGPSGIRVAARFRACR